MTVVGSPLKNTMSCTYTISLVPTHVLSLDHFRGLTSAAGVYSCSYIILHVLVCAVYLRVECLLFQ